MMIVSKTNQNFPMIFWLPTGYLSTVTIQCNSIFYSFLTQKFEFFPNEPFFNSMIEIKYP